MVERLKLTPEQINDLTNIRAIALTIIQRNQLKDQSLTDLIDLETIVHRLINQSIQQ